MLQDRGSVVISAVGVVLLLTAGTHHALELAEVSSPVGPALAFFIDGAPSVGLIYAGWWLHRTDLRPTETWDVARWTVFGVIAGTTIAALIFTVLIIETRPVPEPLFAMLVAAGGGGVVLFVGGYYAARANAVSRRYESIFDNTFQFTGLLDTDGTVIEVNRTALEFGGLQREEVVGQQFDDISWWTHDESVRSRLQEAIQTAANGEISRYETQVYGVNGLKTIDFSARPVDDANGTVTGIVVEGRDITGEEQQRQHLQVMQRIVRHNMRNDITKLRGWTQQLARTEDAATRNAHAERVTGILDSWTKITSDLADIQRRIGSENGLYPTVSVEALIADLVDRKQSADPAATITVSPPEQSATAVPDIVGEAFDELVDNAIAATTGDSQEVVIDVECDDGWTYVSISDNGSGLPQTEASVLETGEETPLTHGQGLGVWKVRMLIKQAGGDVSVDLSDSGTTVRIQLPPTPRENPQQEAPDRISA